MKSTKILTMAALMLAVVLGSCKKDDYKPIDSLCPKVTSTNPPDKATAVPIDQIITATFNEEMDPETITETSFTLHGSIIPGTVTYTDSTAVFTPTDPLTPNHTYTGRIATTVKDLMGNALQEEYVWTFNTDTLVTPHVIATDPVSNAANVALNKVVTATFDMPMDAATITGATFVIKHGATPITGTVSYSGVTATFNPTTDFSLGLTYTATITSNVKNLAGTNMTSDYTWSFSTGAIVAPIVISTDPLNLAAGVSLSKTVTATFSMPMNASTLNTGTFTLKQGSTTVPGVVTYVGTTASYNPVSNLLPGTLYTATITTGAINLAGTAMANNYVWTFTTAVLTPPLVISTDPVNNATNVAITKTLTATFNMAMDPTTINSATFTLKNGSNVKVGTVSYNGTTATFNPTTDLLPGTLYTATITTGSKNTAGTSLANNYVWTFTTAAAAPNAPLVISTDPLNNATGVAVSKTVTATFNMAMNAATINATTFTIKQGTTVVAGVISYAGNVATFNPTLDFAPGLLYTATITTGATSGAGVALANNYVWTFTTLAAANPPLIISTDPLNNATAVPLNKTVTATFNMAMNAGTINGTTFTVKQGTTVVAGAVSYAGNIATFNPTLDFAAGLVYTATITTGATSAGGTALASNYVWTFTTLAGSPPLVISTDPLNNATGVAVTKTLTANFNMAMNGATINATTFTVKQGTTVIAGAVSYAGNVATFNPTLDLLPGLLYTATITTGATSNTGIAMVSDYVWTFTTLAPIAPLVISTDPTNNATGVALNKTVTATFNMAMNPTTINGLTFTVKQGLTPIAGAISYTGNVATFNPTLDFLPGLVYTATISTGATSAGGTALAANYVWTFTTLVGAPPIVIATDPLTNATGVALNKTVTATFNMAMNGTTLNGTTFTVKQGITVIAGAISYAGNVATFNPTIDFLPGLVYTATITTGATSAGGTALANDYVWTFTTLAAATPLVISTDPLNNATGVALNKTITANFNMAMDPTTINTLTFTLEEGVNTILGVVTYVGTTASFDPTSNLQSGKTYTATITTGAENVGGTGLASNYVWTFSTLAPSGPIAPNLNSAGDFGILAATTVTNNAGLSQIINMDVGVYPGTAVTGFPPGIVVNGVIMTAASPAPAPATLLAAKNDLTAAYLFAEGASSPAPITVSGNIGVTTLAPGIYKSTSTLAINGSSVTLDAGGDANAVWIFQISSTLISTTGGSVVLAGGAQAKNIYWQVGSSATIGDNTAFYGNVLALVSITMNTNATATGRMLTQTGAVVLTSTNIITKP